jgi:hypothetical protein
LSPASARPAAILAAAGSSLGRPQRSALVRALIPAFAFCSTSAIFASFFLVRSCVSSSEVLSVPTFAALQPTCLFMQPPVAHAGAGQTERRDCVGL